MHKREALSLANAAWRATYNWENSLLRTLESQALVPLFNIDPALELGMDGHEDVLVERLRLDPAYPSSFREAFPERENPVSVGAAVYAIASFVRTLASADSRYDRYRLGDASALSTSEKRGMELFHGKAKCGQCHSGFTFTDAEWRPGIEPSEIPFPE